MMPAVWHSCRSRRWPATWLLILTLMNNTAALAAGAPANARRLGLIVMAASPKTLPHVRGLMTGLEEAGYQTGQNIIIEQISSDNEADLRAALDKLILTPLDVIVAPGSFEAALAQKATARVPIVFAPASDPVRQGFVKTLARPGGNLTGLAFSRGPDDYGKQLAMFHQTVPGRRRLVAFYDGRAAVAAPVDAMASIEQVARHLNIQLDFRPVESMSQAARIIESLPRGASNGVFIICGALVRGLEPLIAATDKSNLPVYGCNSNQVADDGALATYSPDIFNIGYGGAWYVDRIFKGARPNELPVTLPSKFQWIINLKRAKALGITVPRESLILADRVFQ